MSSTAVSKHVATSIQAERNVANWILVFLWKKQLMFISFRYNQGRDSSHNYLHDYEDDPSRNIEEVSSYCMGTLESSKNSGLSSSSYELSQYINGAEHMEPVHTSDAGESADGALFSPVRFTERPPWLAFACASYFFQSIGCQLLWSTRSLMRLSALGPQASSYGSLQACPPRRTSASWKSTVWRLVQHEPVCITWIVFFLFSHYEWISIHSYSGMSTHHHLTAQ